MSDRMLVLAPQVLKELNKARCRAGLKPLVTKTRRCIQCRREFKTTWLTVRVCNYCRYDLKHCGCGYDYETYVSAKE